MSGIVRHDLRGYGLSLASRMGVRTSTGLGREFGVGVRRLGRASGVWDGHQNLGVGGQEFGEGVRRLGRASGVWGGRKEFGMGIRTLGWGVRSLGRASGDR